MDQPHDDDDDATGNELEKMLAAMGLDPSKLATMKPVTPLAKHRELDAFGRKLDVITLASADLDGGLQMLGGIEGLMETILMWAGATQEDEGPEVLEDVSRTLLAGEELKLMAFTPRRGVVLLVVAGPKEGA